MSSFFKRRMPALPLYLGFLLFCGLVALSVLAPFIATHDPYDLGAQLLAPPSAEHFFGTDGLGRDVFSMCVYGTRTSLGIGIVVSLLSSSLGTLIGGTSGYIGGRIDWIVYELLNMMMMLPMFFIILIVVALYGSSLKNIVLVMALTSWSGTARLMRSQAISLRERTFVKSARTIGESHGAILWRHIFPNGMLPIIADATSMVSAAILSEAGLSFLGLGDPTIVSWGKMISQGKVYLPDSWWISAFPGFCIVLTVLAFYLIGEGLRKRLQTFGGSRVKKQKGKLRATY